MTRRRRSVIVLFLHSFFGTPIERHVTICSFRDPASDTRVRAGPGAAGARARGKQGANKQQGGAITNTPSRIKVQVLQLRSSHQDSCSPAIQACKIVCDVVSSVARLHTPARTKGLWCFASCCCCRRTPAWACLGLEEATRPHGAAAPCCARPN